MPFIQIPSQDTLSDLIDVYHQRVAHYRTNSVSIQYSEEVRDRYLGFVHVLGNAIEALEELMINPLEVRATLVTNKREQWKRLVQEWQSEQGETYQLGRIRMLETVVANLGDLLSYE